MNRSVAVLVGVAALAVGLVTGCSAKQQPVGEATSSSAAAPAAPAAPADAGRSVASYFKVGDCFKDSITGTSSVTLVDCATPHSGEVYAVFMLPDGPFPGNDIGKQYRPTCGGAARAIDNPALATDPTLHTNIKFPDENSWAMGDRSVTCIATSDPPRTGSIQNAG